jgi:hypothetical protein
VRGSLVSGEREERRQEMATFMDVHTGMKGITKDQLAEAHRKDLEFQGKENVRFVQAWADPTSGKVFCLSEGPDQASVKRVHERAGHAVDEIYEVSVSVK